MAPVNDLAGMRVHFLRVLRLADGVKPRSWVCVCDCGKETVVVTSLLTRGVRKSCGCYKKAVLGERSRTHGMSNSRVKGYASRTYGVWQAMRDRCSNPNRADYYRYGGRGVFVCAEWQSFEVFLQDMGHPPAGATLDRIDNDGPYCKENCRWASRKEQVYNSTAVRIVQVGDRLAPLRVWLGETGVPRHRFYNLLKKGVPADRAVFGYTT
jgi:hypothetical protein